MKHILLLMLMSSVCDSANILAIVPISVKSHYIVMEPLLRQLAARGHKLTVFTSFPSKQPLPNLTDIDLSEGRLMWINRFEYDAIEELMGDVFKSINHMIDWAADDCKSVLKSEKFKNFDFHKEKYDLLITEMFAGDCFVHFAHKLQIPFISIVTSVPPPWIPDKFGLPDNPSYIPNYLLGYSPKMNFLQRIINTMIVYYSKTMFEIYSNPRIQRLAEDFFQEKLPWVGDLAWNSSLLLVNNHFSLGHSQPLPPNVIEIGGIHVKERQSLNKDLQDILDKSTKGVILLSFGSMVRVATIPKEKIQMLLNVFAKIPQTVLLKFEEELPEASKNVIIRSWLPQRDILEHKNLKAFVSHGGLASVMEAVQFAKPLVGVPFFADQFQNIQNVVEKGAGVMVDLKTMTEADFAHAIDQVLNNPKVGESMKRLSKQFQDRPMTPLESAVYWTEHVLNHQGAPHLRPASTSLSIYQLWLLDVIGALVAAGVVLCLLSKCLLNVIFMKLRRKEKADTTKKRN